MGMIQINDMQTIYFRKSAFILSQIRFNPNMDAYNWILTGGQSGLVRVNCARGLSCSVMLKELRETQAQFSAMFQSQEPDDSATAVRHSTADTVQVH